MKKQKIIGFILGVSIACPTFASAKNLSLSEFIKHAISHNSEIKMKDQDILSAEGQLDEVKSYMLPSISNTTILAPLFEERGTPLTSTANYDNWGPWVKSNTTVIQPIFAYGKMTHYGNAAKKKIEAEKKQRKMKMDEVIFGVKEYYYGVQTAYGLLEQIEESEKKLADVIKRVDELIKVESGEVRKQDAFKLKTLFQELKQKKELAVKSQKLATSALAFRAGFDDDKDIDLDDKALKKEPFKLESLKYYQDLAVERRPELKALEEGIQARQSLVDAEKTNRLPVFFVGAIFDIADTPNDIRTRQASPYAYDPYNSVDIGVGVGAKWNLDFWKVNAKVKSLKAEYHKLVHQKELADRGIPLEVKKAYLDYQEALNNIDHSTEQVTYAKKWFVQSVMAWGVGVGDAREVLESVIFKGLSDKNYHDALMNHNISVGSLSKATGTELLSTLKY